MGAASTAAGAAAGAADPLATTTSLRSAQPSTPAAASFTTPPPAIRTGQAAPPQICRRYNYGNCPNTAATYALPSGTKLIHKCEVCNGNHSRVQFH
jgi:hypothetical protein